MPTAAAGDVFYNTDGGLAAPGGFLDQLGQVVGQVQQQKAQLAGLAPALQTTGVPTPSSPGMLSRFLGIGGAANAAQPTTPPQMAPMQMSAPASAPSNVGPDANTIARMIGTSAQRLGIDPMTAIRVARSEGGLRIGVPGDNGSSIGPFQLHYGGVAGGPNSGKGLGDDYTAATGFRAGDPAHIQNEIDFALNYAAKNGWSAFHGAAKSGIGAFSGIGGAPAGGGVQLASYAPQSPQGGPMPQATAGNSQGTGASPPTPQNMASAAPTPGSLTPGGSAAAVGPGGAVAPSAPGASQGLMLPGGMTTDALGAMIANPATREMGLNIWQTALMPKTPSFGKPGEVAFIPGRAPIQIPYAPMDLGPGHQAANVNQPGAAPIASVPPTPIPLKEGEALQSPAGGPPIAYNPQGKHVSDLNGHAVVVDPSNSTAKDVTPPGVPSTADLKATEGVNSDIIAKVASSKEQAIAASKTIDAINRQQTALDQGAITGGGAGAALKIRSALSGLLGVPDPGVEHTQEFIAASNSKAAEIAKSLSNSGHTTNSDLNMAKIISGADPSYSINALREIGRAQQQIAADTINRHNNSLAAASRLIPPLGQKQDFYSVPMPKTYDFGRAAALSNARAAISRGAPRAAVIQRLQQNGIDPGQL